LLLNCGLEGFSPRGKSFAIAVPDFINLGLLRGIIEKRSIGSASRAMIYAPLSVVTALGDVLRDAGEVEPAWSGHDLTPGLKP
jgi:hypothetical protein